jgi:hypothetical protein
MECKGTFWTSFDGQLLTSLPSVLRTFTRRTSGYCLGIFMTVNICVKCSTFHYYPLFSLSYSLFCSFTILWFSCSPSDFKFIKLAPLLWMPLNYLIIQIIISVFIDMKIPPSLSQDFSTYHSNVFTATLSLSKRRACIAWEPNKMLFPPHRNKRLSFLSIIYSLLLHFSCPSKLSPSSAYSIREWKLTQVK